MGKIWRGIVWATARNTEPGRRVLGQETLLEQGVREQREGLMAVAALTAFQNYQYAREGDSCWRDDGTRGKSLQYQDGDVKVEVVNGYSRDHDYYTTDIKVIHRDPRVTQHLHVVFDERGNEIVNEWRSDH